MIENQNQLHIMTNHPTRYQGYRTNELRELMHLQNEVGWMDEQTNGESKILYSPKPNYHMMGAQKKTHFYSPKIATRFTISTISSFSIKVIVFAVSWKVFSASVF
jgi:hypothetical protein